MDCLLYCWQGFWIYCWHRGNTFFIPLPVAWSSILAYHSPRKKTDRMGQSYSFHHHRTWRACAITFAVSTGIFRSPFSYRQIVAPATPTRSASSLMVSFLFRLYFVRLLGWSNEYSFPRLREHYIMKRKTFQYFLPNWYWQIITYRGILNSQTALQRFGYFGTTFVSSVRLWSPLVPAGGVAQW